MRVFWCDTSIRTLQKRVTFILFTWRTTPWLMDEGILRFGMKNKCWAAMAKGLIHHFTLMSCNPECIVTDINPDGVEWQKNPRNIWLAESECIGRYCHAVRNSAKAPALRAAQWQWFETLRVARLTLGMKIISTARPYLKIQRLKYRLDAMSTCGHLSK